MKYIKIYTIPFIFLLLLPDICLSEEINIYYLRLDLKIHNGVVVDSNLLIIPAKDEYRIESFALYRITGRSSDTSTDDILSSAKYDALKNLLQSQGVKSIKNVNFKDQERLTDDSIMSYEGYIKTPYIIINQGYLEKNQWYTVTFDIHFAPMKYPASWKMNYFKKKLYDFLHNVISMFLS